MEELEKNKGDKFYPGHHMWTYCTFLGKYTASNGENYDLGIYENSGFTKHLAYSNATVYGKEDYEYLSGSFFLVTNKPDWIGNELAREVVKRAKAKGINVELQEVTSS
jgi:hypothetical protein